MSNDTFQAEASPRKDKLLSQTAKGNQRLNATRRNPRAEEEGQPATKSLNDIVEYAYTTTKAVTTIKFWDKPEITLWPADYTPKEKAS